MNINDEVVLILGEECAEVIQAISKCQRFGIDNYKPGKPKTNREHLEEELGDLVAMIEIMAEKEMISMKNVNTAKINKIEKLKTWSNIFTESAD